MVSAVAALTLTACSEKEVVEEKEATEVVAADEAVADETTTEENSTEEAAEETPAVEENVLVLHIGGETKEVEVVRSLIGEKVEEEGVAEEEWEGKFSVKRVEELPVKGDFLYADEGPMKGVNFQVLESDINKSSASGQAKSTAEQFGATEAATEMNLEDYPALKEKYDYYFQSVRSDYNRYAFTKEYPERGTVLVIDAEMPVEIANEETVALIEAMAASVKYND